MTWAPWRWSDLHVVGRPVAAIAHLHDPRLRIAEEARAGSRSWRAASLRPARPPRRRAAPRSWRAPCAPCQPPRPIFRRRQLARLDPTLRRRRVLLDLRRQLAHRIRHRRPMQLRQTTGTLERRPLASDCSFMPSTASVLIDRARGDQPGQRLRQKLVQRRPASLPEVRQRVVVHAHPAEQPR